VPRRSALDHPWRIRRGHDGRVGRARHDAPSDREAQDHHILVGANEALAAPWPQSGVRSRDAHDVRAGPGDRNTGHDKRLRGLLPRIPLPRVGTVQEQVRLPGRARLGPAHEPHGPLDDILPVRGRSRGGGVLVNDAPGLERAREPAGHVPREGETRPRRREAGERRGGHQARTSPLPGKPGGEARRNGDARAGHHDDEPDAHVVPAPRPSGCQSLLRGHLPGRADSFPGWRRLPGSDLACGRPAAEPGAERRLSASGHAQAGGQARHRARDGEGHEKGPAEEDHAPDHRDMKPALACLRADTHRQAPGDARRLRPPRLPAGLHRRPRPAPRAAKGLKEADPPKHENGAE